MCYHKLVDGFGGMGDAVVCVKCGYSKYPEAMISYDIFVLLGRVIKNDGTYAHQDHFPYVIKFPEEITFKTDWKTYTHFFDKTGQLLPHVPAQ